MRALLTVVFILIGWMPMANAKPMKKAFIIEPGLFTEDPVVVINGKPIEAEGWSPLLFDLEDAVKDNKVAADLAATHAAWGRASGIVLWTGMGAAATYAAINAHDKFSPAVFWGTFGGSIIAALGLEKVSKIYLYRTLRAYNAGDAATPPSKEIKVNLLPVQNGGALSFALEF